MIYLYLKLYLSIFSYIRLSEPSSETELQHSRKLLWTAPEFLRLPKPEWPRYGTQKGDVYSFGVIAQEVIYRAPAFFTDCVSPKGNSIILLYWVSRKET